MTNKTIETLKKFDVVTNYIFSFFPQKEEDTNEVDIPYFMDEENIRNWEKATKQALLLSKNGLLDEMYNRIEKGII